MHIDVRTEGEHVMLIVRDKVALQLVPEAAFELADYLKEKGKEAKRRRDGRVVLKPADVIGGIAPGAKFGTPTIHQT